MQTALMEVTHQAFDKIAQLIIDEGDFELKLRVYIVGGGCQGFNYGFAFDKKCEPEDELITTERNGSAISVVIDPMSGQYLVNAKLDYVENLTGARFIIDNPNAQTTCGCGASFSL